MSEVFVDSVGLLALWNASDQWHDAATRAFAQINDGRTRLLTTAFILLECGNAASRTPFRNDAFRAQEQFEKAGTLIWPAALDWKLAWQNYQRGGGDAAGIVDQASFVVMRRLGLSKAFTNDRHFRAAGFETLF
jgi:uncharacterized protein